MKKYLPSFWCYSGAVFWLILAVATQLQLDHYRFDREICTFRVSHVIFYRTLPAITGIYTICWRIRRRLALERSRTSNLGSRNWPQQSLTPIQQSSCSRRLHDLCTGQENPPCGERESWIPAGTSYNCVSACLVLQQLSCTGCPLMAARSIVPPEKEVPTKMIPVPNKLHE